MRMGREILRMFYDLPLLQQSQPTACLGYRNINFSFLSFCGCLRFVKNPAVGCLEYGLTVLTWAAKLAPVGVEEEGNRQTVAFLHENQIWWNSGRGEAVVASISWSLGASGSVWMVRERYCLPSRWAVLGLPWERCGARLFTYQLYLSLECSLTGRWIHVDVMALALLLSHGFCFHDFICVYRFI